jgi:predicted CoA-binding protein
MAATVVSIENLDKIFHPKRVAVVGASDNVRSVGYTVLRNLVGSGFPGVVYPVNPKRESVQGIHAYPTSKACRTPPIWRSFARRPRRHTSSARAAKRAPAAS